MPKRTAYNRTIFDLQGSPHETGLELLLFVRDFAEYMRYAASYDEIRRALEYASKSSVFYFVERLIEAGWLEQKKGDKRTLRITDKCRNFLDVEYGGAFFTTDRLDAVVFEG